MIWEHPIKVDGTSSLFIIVKFYGNLHQKNNYKMIR